VTASELGRVVKERMSKQASKGIQQLLSINRVAPNAAFQMLMHTEERTATPTAGSKGMLSSEEHTETPTAGSGLVLQPPGLRGIVPATDEELTLRTRPRSQERRIIVDQEEDGPTTLLDTHRGRNRLPKEFVVPPTNPRQPVQSAVRRVEVSSLPPAERGRSSRSKSILPIAPAHLNTVLLVLVMVLAFAVVLLALR
jgi:hypothetical protein